MEAFSQLCGETSHVREAAAAVRAEFAVRRYTGLPPLSIGNERLDLTVKFNVAG